MIFKGSRKLKNCDHMIVTTAVWNRAIEKMKKKKEIAFYKSIIKKKKEAI